MQELKQGDTINNRYEVTRKLGAGAMGSVYLCEDVVENNIQVALKVLNSNNVEDQDEWAKGEYEALTRLRHPNLARVYNFGRIGSSNDYFIVSEFIKGVDLYSATEYVNYEELNDILVQTCRALEYIHSRGYIHFDVKPDNILVTRHRTFGLKEGSKVLQEDFASSSSHNRSVYSTPSVKLIDFGLAERITGSFSYVIKGTLNYLAPEIISGKTPDHRADLYSLGVSLYQITNRELPHQLDDNDFHSTSIQTMHRSDLFEIHMKKHPEYLRKTILKLLEEDPAKRFQSAREVIQFFNDHSGRQYDVETKETQKSYLHSTRMVGRKKEIHLLKKLCERIFFSATRDEENPEDEQSIYDETTGDEATNDEITNDEPVEIDRDEDEDDGENIPTSMEDVPGAEDTEDDFEEELLTEIRAEIATERREPEFLANVWVTGEMGIGKSRLLEEFQHYLRLNDIQIYTGNCYEGTSNAYQPFLEILRQMVYGLGLHSKTVGKYRQVLYRLLPEVRDKSEATDNKDVSLPPDQEKIFFIDRMSHFLMEVAGERPYVLVVNNLHWADEVSVELLEALVERIKECRRKKNLKLLMLCSLRIDEQFSESFKLFVTRNREDVPCREIPLRRLKRSQIVELLQSMLGFTEVPQQFLERIEEKTGGNPLFIQETLKALQDEGVLSNLEGGWEIKTTSYNRIEIPHSLEELLLQRILRLEPFKREILEVMSVLNRPVSPKVLQKFKRFASLPILAHLRDLEETGLVAKVFEGGKLTFQIDQPKMREILYSNLEKGARRKYHGEVGEFFAEVYGGHEEEVSEDLAYHYQRSDLLDRSLEMSLKAGDRLKAIYANEKALEFYVYILERIEDDESKTELLIEAREKVGQLCTIMGKYDMAETSYDALLHMETDCLAPPDVSRYSRKKGKIFEIQGDYDTALRCYKGARNHLSNLQDPTLLDERIRVFNSIGWVYVCMGKYEKAMAISVEALRVIEGTTEKVEHAMIFSTIGSANNFKGQFNRAVEFHTRSLKIQENLENIPEIAACLNNLGKAYVASADYGEAREHFRRALKNSREIGDPFGRATSLNNFAWLYFRLGCLDQAEAHLAESLQLTRDYNIRTLNIENHLLYGKIKRAQADYSRAESYFFRALTAYSKQGNRWGLCTTILEIVGIHRLRGSYVEAATMIEEAERYANSLDINLLRSRCLFERGRVLRDSGDSTDKVLELFQESLSTIRNLEVPELQSEILRETGDLLVRERRLEEAKHQYSKAEDRLRAILERLPEELQGFYCEKHRGHFRLQDSVVLIEKRPATSPDSEGASPSVRPTPVLAQRSAHVQASNESDDGPSTVECMNDLMRILKNASSLEAFLQVVLKRVLEVSRSRSAFVLAVQGDQLHIRAALHSERSKTRDPQRLLALRLIEKVLREKKALVIPDMARDRLLGELGGLIKQGARSLIIQPYQGAYEEGVLYFVDPVPTSGALPDDTSFYDFFGNLIPLALMHLEEPVPQT